jgi:anti-sigma regulatory factor (Ser/Thr protein kinase)
MVTMSQTAAGRAAATRYAATFPGRPDQVQRARHEVARYLAGHPAADDAVLIISELASNAVLHSSSNGQSFTVRTEIHTGYLRLEVEDLGGPWLLKPRDTGRAHGLDVVEALAGPDNWGADGDDSGRVAWAKLDMRPRAGGQK